MIFHELSPISRPTATWRSAQPKIIMPERWLAARVGRLTGSEAMAASEAMAMWYGMTSGAKDAFKLAGKSLWTGESTDPLGKVETPILAITAENMGLDPANWLGRGVDLLGETVRLPGRFLMAEDDFLKQSGFEWNCTPRPTASPPRKSWKAGRLPIACRSSSTIRRTMSNRPPSMRPGI